MRAVIVTGGAGYIGAHTCKALSLAGFLPVTIDNLSLGRAEFVRWGPLVRADVGDPAVVAATIEQYDAVAVLHFAALSAVGDSIANSSQFYRNNTLGTLGVLEGMRSAGCGRLVFSSTAAVYGAPDASPIRETAATRPINPYGWSKLFSEQIIRDFAAFQDFTFVLLRYFNAAGADPATQIGEFREVETHLIPRAMMSLQGHILDFQVFGRDFPTPDGTAVRDYVHVTDLAEAHVAGLRRLLDGAGSVTLNIGAGRGYSVAEVLDAIAHVSGRARLAASGPRRAGDPPELIADASAARDWLGITPTRSRLDTIIDTAWKWHAVAHPAVGLARVVAR